VNLLVPAYFYPSNDSTYWDDLAAAAKTVGTTIVLNPSTGPGTAVDQNYVSAITKVRDSGGKVIGYVHTNYGKRPLSDITGEIDRYISYYQVDGFFIDQMTTDKADENVAYYKSVRDYIKGLSEQYSVTGNPGTMPDEIYLSHPLVDRVVVFEGSESMYANFLPSEWQSRYPRERFAHLVYDANSEQMEQVFNLSSSNIVGNLYVTGEKTSTPYDALPRYWDQEVRLASAVH
jgi:hypothetical protein